MKCRFLQAYLAVPFLSIWLCTKDNAVSSGARSWFLTACIPKIAACNFHIQRLSSICPFWSLFSAHPQIKCACLLGQGSGFLLDSEYYTQIECFSRGELYR